jgi:hypothetical protein
MAPSHCWIKPSLAVTRAIYRHPSLSSCCQAVSLPAIRIANVTQRAALEMGEKGKLYYMVIHDCDVMESNAPMISLFYFILYF